MAKVWDDEKKCYVSDSTPAPVFSEPEVLNELPSESWTKKKLVEYCDENDVEYNSGDTKQDLLDKING
tara:strand:+ start:2339 stop:2542 length:204 start_codon:yes stop_codon:yes gene_type:complete